MYIVLLLLPWFFFREKEREIGEASEWGGVEKILSSTLRTDLDEELDRTTLRL